MGVSAGGSRGSLPRSGTEGYLWEDSMKIGYFLSSEEWGPGEQLEQARMAEEAGFEALWVSDHYHPWNDEQGNSPFVWSVIGGLSQATSLPVTTGVTCPTIRIHPAIIAQAAATSKVMLDGRFSLGVGTGENLNEHILGDRWPQTNVEAGFDEVYVQQIGPEQEGFFRFFEKELRPKL